MTITMTIFIHHPHVSLVCFLFCWWHHNRLLMTSQWLENCDAITWIVTSNELDIDFIHNDIHGWSYKKQRYYIACLQYIQGICTCSMVGWERKQFIPSLSFCVISPPLPQSYHWHDNSETTLTGMVNLSYQSARTTNKSTTKQSTTKPCVYFMEHIDGLVPDCSNSIALAMELLQSCTKPSTYLLPSRWQSFPPPPL